MHMKLVQLGPPAIETMMRRPHLLPLSLTDLLATLPMHWSEQISRAPAPNRQTDISPEQDS